jgi:hypothetical protein
LPADLSGGAIGTAAVQFNDPYVSVTEGQQLQLRVRARSPLVAGTSADVYAGGTLTVGGNADPPRELVFKVIVF